MREQVERLEAHPDALPNLVDVGLGSVDLDVLEPDLAAGGHLEHVHAAQESRLARTTGAEDDDDLTLDDIHVYAAQDLEIAEGLVQVR